MRVAVAEDNEFYRAGLVRFLQMAGATVLHEAASGQELLAYLHRGARPDAVILDIRMADRDDDGLLAALDIAERYPATGILLLSHFNEADYLERLLESGSAGRGYLLKTHMNRVEDLREALDRVTRGETYTDPDLVIKMMKQRHERNPADHLTARQTQVVALLAGGATNAKIATEIGTTSGAIEGAISGIYEKFGLPDTPDYNRRVLITLRWLGMN